MNRPLLIASILILFFSTFGSHRSPLAKSEVFKVDTLAAGLTVPWDIVFMPDGTMMFTERAGRVRLFRGDSLLRKPALTIGGIEVSGKMGLLGLCLHPDFERNGFVYLAYNYRSGDQTFLRVARYRFADDSLLSPTTIIDQIPGVFNHTGCRLVFDPGKKLFISTGDADVPREAQNLKQYNGKILRLNDDGSIPADNPFIHNDTARKEIWSYGHRNPQGLAFQPGTGKLYSSEHGPTGGDEINVINKGNNYGWPVIHHREHKDGMMNPLMEFTPSIGPAEALFYSGKAFPVLKDHLLVACMRGEAILDVRFEEQKIGSYRFLLKNVFGRIRALTEGPDGYLYISTSQVDPPESKMKAGDDGYDLLLRLRPAASLPDTPRLTAAINSRGPITENKNAIGRAVIQYQQLCAGCHGDRLQGIGAVPSLVDKTWLNGSSRSAIIRSITSGIVSKGMPAWKGVLTSAEIAQVADYIKKSGR